MASPLSKAIDSATINKAFTVLNNVNVTSKVDGYVVAINALLAKAPSTYVDFGTSIDASILSMNKLMASETLELKSEKDTITYEAYVFDKIKPVGEKVGLTLDTQSNSTYFEGKINDFTKAKTLVSRTSLKQVTKVSPTVNMTITS